MGTWLAALLFLGGCATVPTGPPPYMGNGFSSPQTAIEAVSRICDQTKAYQFTARVTVTAPGAKAFFRVAFITQSPDRLRLESLPIIGPPDFFLTARDGRFAAYLPGSREFLIGAADAETMSGILPVSLPWSAEKWVSVLQGRPGIMGKQTLLEGEQDGSLYRVDSRQGKSVKESYWIDPESHRLSRMEQSIMGHLNYRVHFTAFRNINGCNFPANILIESGSGETIAMTYGPVKIKKENRDDIFDLSAPAGSLLRVF